MSHSSVCIELFLKESHVQWAHTHAIARKTGYCEFVKRVEGVVAERINRAPQSSLPVALPPQPEDPFSQEMEVIEKQAAKYLQNKNKIILFCKGFIESARKSHQHQTLNPQIAATKELLGQVIFLIDEDGDQLLKRATGTYIINSPHSYIKQDFENILLNKKKALDAIVRKEAEIGLIDPKAFSSSEQAKLISTCLVSSSSFFNLSIVDSLLKFICQNDSNTDEHPIATALHNLKNNSSLQQAIKNTPLPASNSPSSADLVRASLGLPADIVIDKAHAMRSHLYAHLSALPEYLPQHSGAQNSYQATCFATLVASCLKKLRPEKVADDLNALLKNGYLERTLNQQNHRITLDLEPYDPILLTPITQVTPSLWKSSAMQSAIHFMGIAKEQIDEHLLIGKTATPKEIITTLAQKFFPEEASRKAALGHLAFCAASSHPLLRCWTEALGVMAEIQPQHIVAAKIISCARVALKSHFTPEHISQSAIISHLFREFLQQLRTTTLLTHLSKEGGVFMMEGVSSAKDFRHHVTKNFDSALQKIVSSQSKESHEDLTLFASKISHVISQKPFLEHVIANFDPTNRDIDDIEVNIEKQSFLPWKASYGNDPFILLDTYFEKPAEILATNTPTNAKDFFEQLFAFVKKRSPGENADLGLYARHHVSTLCFNHPDFQAIITRSDNAQQASKGYLSKRTPALHSTLIKPEMQEKIVTWIAEHLIYPDQAPNFYSDMERLSSLHTLKQFRDIMLEHATRTYAPDSLPQSIRQKMAPLLDRYITQLLFETSQEQLKEAEPLIFAKTDWIVDGHDVYFCFYREPLAGTIQLGTIHNNGSILLPLDQKEWVEDISWAIFNQQKVTV